MPTLSLGQSNKILPNHEGGFDVVDTQTGDLLRRLEKELKQEDRSFFGLTSSLLKEHYSQDVRVNGFWKTIGKLFLNITGAIFIALVILAFVSPASFIGLMKSGDYLILRIVAGMVASWVGWKLLRIGIAQLGEWMDGGFRVMTIDWRGGWQTRAISNSASSFSHQTMVPKALEGQVLTSENQVKSWKEQFQRRNGPRAIDGCEVGKLADFTYEYRNKGFPQKKFCQTFSCGQQIWEKMKKRFKANRILEVANAEDLETGKAKKEKVKVNVFYNSPHIILRDLYRIMNEEKVPTYKDVSEYLQGKKFEECCEQIEQIKVDGGDVACLPAHLKTPMDKQADTPKPKRKKFSFKQIFGLFGKGESSNSLPPSNQ